jgi:hypothetical protein
LEQFQRTALWSISQLVHCQLICPWKHDHAERINGYIFSKMLVLSGVFNTRILDAMN